jgi:uncharacterized membrane protein YvbJ
MALISCPECNRDVSDSAPTCPNCGVPIASARETKAAGTSLTTIQETSKKLKLHMISAVAVILIGVLFSIIDIDRGGKNSSISVILIIGGLGLYFITRFRIWWHHK